MKALADQAASEVLEEAEEERPDALVRLSNAIARELPEAFAAVGPPPERDEPGVDGLHRYDARAVDHLRAMGTSGSVLRRAASEVAQTYYRVAREDWERVAAGALSWEEWSESAPHEVARAVGWVLWNGEVKAGVERAEARLPGIIVDVHESLALTMTRGLQVREDDRGRRSVVRPNSCGSTMAVAEVPDIPVVDQNVLDAAMDLRRLGSRHALPLVEYLAELAQGGPVASGVNVGSGGGTITFGSWNILAREALRWPSDRALRPQTVTDLRLTAHLLAHTPIRWRDGVQSSALWVLEDDLLREGAPRFGPRFAPTPRLQAGETHRARLGRSLGGREREGLRIVPLVRPRTVEPVPDSNRRSFGAQASWVRFLWLHFVRNAAKLWDEPGGIPVTPADVSELADMAQLPRAVACKMLLHLCVQEVVTTPASGFYAPADPATRKFIKDGCSPERREKGVARGRRRGRP